VGKTCAMLQEAHRNQDEAMDVVVGWLETHGRPAIVELMDDLEVVAAREVLYKAVVLREMDVDTIISRRPQVALVDELAHSNVPESKNEKRYQDVEDLLAAGITVISTLDIQHIEGLNDTVSQLTGVAVRETVPDWIVDQADEVELIETPPDVLIERIKRGHIYPSEQAKWALDGFFTRRNLSGLQDLAQWVIAERANGHRPRDSAAKEQVNAILAPSSRIMVAIDHRPIGEKLARHAWNMSAAPERRSHRGPR
jgi:two-component system, OmpR family, sensor histidine kinase KdpD